jgi:hypothetical protein
LKLLLQPNKISADVSVTVFKSSEHGGHIFHIDEHDMTKSFTCDPDVPNFVFKFLYIFLEGGKGEGVTQSQHPS